MWASIVIMYVVKVATSADASEIENRKNLEETMMATRKLVFSIVSGYVKDQAIAEDLTQDTYLKAFTSTDSLKDKDRIKPWLCTIARNLSINWLKKKKEVKDEKGMANVDSLSLSPEIEFERGEMKDSPLRVLCPNTTALFGNKLIIWGGCRSDGTKYFNDGVIYDIEKGTWEKMIVRLRVEGITHGY